MEWTKTEEGAPSQEKQMSTTGSKEDGKDTQEEPSPVTQANVAVACKDEKVEAMETEEDMNEETPADEEAEYGVAEISKSSLTTEESDGNEMEATDTQEDSETEEAEQMDSVASSPMSEEVIEAIVEDVKPGTYVTKSGRTVTVRIKMDYGPSENSKPKGNFECNICFEKFMTKAKLEQHHDDWHSAYPCPTCGKTFKTQSKLKRHKKTHQRKRKEYKVGDFQVIENAGDEEATEGEEATEVEDNDEEGREILEEEPEGDEVLECGTCTKVFKSRGTLQMHRRRFHGKPLRFPCKECNKSYASDKTLEVHIRKVHEQPFKCLECMMSYATEDELSFHINTHTGETFKCKKCDKEFNHKINLTEHDKRMHGDTFSCICEFCGKGFINNSELKQHVAMHSNATPFDCKLCDKSFKRKSGLEVHMATHSTEKAFQCEICGTRFITKLYLKRHTLTHDTSRPYECETCGKRLKTSKLLRLHQKVHSDSKPFVCEFCGRAFKYQYNLTPHRRIHTGVRPFKCDLCGREFIQKVCLQKHKCAADPFQESESPETSPEKASRMKIEPVPGISPVMQQAIALLKQAQDLQEKGIGQKSDNRVAIANMDPAFLTKTVQAVLDKPSEASSAKSQNTKSVQDKLKMPQFPDSVTLPHHADGQPSHATSPEKPGLVLKQEHPQFPNPENRQPVTPNVATSQVGTEKPRPAQQFEVRSIQAMSNLRPVMPQQVPRQETHEDQRSEGRSMAQSQAVPHVSVKSSQVQAVSSDPGHPQAVPQVSVHSQVSVEPAQSQVIASDQVFVQVSIPEQTNPQVVQEVSEPTNSQAYSLVPISESNGSHAFQQVQISEPNSSQEFQQVVISDLPDSQAFTQVNLTEPTRSLVYSQPVPVPGESQEYLQVSVPEPVNSLEVHTSQFTQIVESGNTSNIPQAQFEFVPSGIQERPQQLQYSQVRVTDPGNLGQHQQIRVADPGNLGQHQQYTQHVSEASNVVSQLPTHYSQVPVQDIKIEGSLDAGQVQSHVLQVQQEVNITQS